MKKPLLATLLLVAPLLFTACGGGDSQPQTEAAPSPTIKASTLATVREKYQSSYGAYDTYLDYFLLVEDAVGRRAFVEVEDGTFTAALVGVQIPVTAEFYTPTANGGTAVVLEKYLGSSGHPGRIISYHFLFRQNGGGTALVEVPLDKFTTVLVGDTTNIGQ